MVYRAGFPHRGIKIKTNAMSVFTLTLSRHRIVATSPIGKIVGMVVVLFTSSFEDENVRWLLESGLNRKTFLTLHFSFISKRVVNITQCTISKRAPALHNNQVVSHVRQVVLWPGFPFLDSPNPWLMLYLICAARIAHFASRCRTQL